MTFPLISSPQNERIKAAAKLRDRKGREQQRKILIDGVPEISRAIAAGVKVEQVFLIEDLPDDVAAEAKQWAAAGALLITVTSPVMEKLAYGQRQEVAIAIAAPPATDLNQLTAKIKQTKSNQFFLVIEGIEKPGNLGAILRTADATGVSAVLIADGGTDVFNPNAIRASRGAIFTVPVAAAASEACLTWLRQQNCRLFAARVDGSEEYTAKDYNQPAAFILGSEAHGLTARWQAADITPIRLPLLGQIDSLNLSVTAAVLCYEALRQRAAASQRSP